MHSNHFSFNRQPFMAFPDATGYYPTGTIETAKENILQILKNAAGIPLVFGEPGTGKSLLLRLIEKQINEDGHAVYLANQRLRSPKVLYQHILFAVHQSYCGMDENELRLLFLDHLRQNETCGLVLLIDEAQSVCRSVFEELRVLMHYNENVHANFRVVLAGDRRFEEHLTHPHLAAFQQQVVARCYLENFRWNETEEVIVRQLQQAGCDRAESLFSTDARKTVHQLTEGLPRLVHQLCHQAVTCAVASDARQIDETLVRTAWRILQQLPEEHVAVTDICRTLPFAKNGVTVDFSHATTETAVSPAPENRTPSVIEFGTLEDDDESESAEMPAFEVARENKTQTLIEQEVFPLSEDTLRETCNPIYQLPVFEDDSEIVERFCIDETYREEIPEERDTFAFPQDNQPDFVTLGEALSDKNVKQSEKIAGESCQKLLDELAMMEHLLSREIHIINKMKKIESDCLSRRVRCVSSAQILASFPELSNRR